MVKQVKYLNLILLAVVVALVSVWLYYETTKEELMYFCDDKTIICDLKEAKYHDASLPIEERLDDLLSHMTLQEKIGQLSLVERTALGNKDDLVSYNIGAILSGGGSHPEDNSPAGWRAMVLDFQSYADKTRLKIPILYGIDSVHGHANVPGATVFPHQIALAATNDEMLVQKVYEATAKEMAATGIYWNFAPAVDVVKDHRWGRTFETFGNNAEKVGKMGGAAILGTQGTDEEDVLVLATAKHYLGAGAMVWDSGDNEGYRMDQGEVRLTDEELRAEHLPAFEEAVNVGVQSIMAGLNSWHGKKISSDSYLLTDVLKGELGFKGFVVSDWFGVYEIPGNDYYNTATALMAGIDMVMLPYDYPKFKADVEQSILSHRLSQERLDDAVRRVLRVKFNLGLFERKAPLISDLGVVGSKAHRELAREAVRRSQVVLKDTNKILPLPKNASYIIAGSSADNVGRQSGGWTIDWQGVDGNPLPGATSILVGIKQALPLGAKIDYDRDGNFNITKKAEYGIVIVGEQPYAEGVGDNERPHLSNEDLAVIERVRQLSERIVVIIVAGRPLDIKAEARQWDAVIAAWLPGSEGQGISDVLFGDYPFTGDLPIPWEL